MEIFDVLARLLRGNASAACTRAGGTLLEAPSSKGLTIMSIGPDRRRPPSSMVPSKTLRCSTDDPSYAG